MTVLVGPRVSIHQGLDGQDDNIEALMSLWEQLQLCALELAAQPECDLITFALTGFFLGVITAKIDTNVKPTELEGPSEVQGTILDELQDSFQAPVPKKKKKKNGKSKANAAVQHALLGFDKAPNVPPKISPHGYISPWTPVCEGVESRVVLGSRIGTNEFRSRARLWQDSENIFGDHSREAEEHLAIERAWGDYSSDEEEEFPVIEPAPVPVGLIYLSASPFTQTAPNQVGELNLGIILDSKYRGKGFACEAIQLAVKHAFEVEHCHRIQASLINLDWAHKDRMTALLTQLRFGHEGTRRRAFYNPMMAEWQDVTTLAILATDWSIRSFLKPAPKSLWDELFLRHQREREELLRWDEKQSRSLKRSASTETLRPPVGALVDLGAETDSSAESDASSTTSSKGKWRAVQDDDGTRDNSPSPAPSFGSYDDAQGDAHFSSDSMFRIIGARSQSPALSDSSIESVPFSEVSGGGSDWDMVEMSSTSSSAGSSFGGDE
ncbi:hypothetical protein FB45DRAFT_829529 [Roridomyces roridus]|uniref:N-acetyltransferase domain-containing protein n=1 Tax=Roridomyces roridus TaxID=1738132 RepID=A0AAD7C2Z2_9AGAR|nr:hypothetical protein FB45DRAFT_829529 [Roridomyces roridus]